MSGVFAKGKRSMAISDRSGMAFPYREMVREWNGFLVHYSEYEPKQPQLDPRFHGGDPQALRNARPQPASKASLILLDPNPFTTVLQVGVGAFVNVYSVDHQRKTGDIVRLRGAAQVASAGSGGADATNLQAFATIPSFGGMSVNSATGYTITVGQKNSDGTVTTAPGTLTSPENYFYISLGLPVAGMVDGVSGGGHSNSAGPVTLGVVNG